MVHRYLEETSLRRLTGSLSTDLDRVQKELRVPPRMLNAFIEVLNFPWFLRHVVLYEALERFLTAMLDLRRLEFQQREKSGGMLLLCVSANSRLRAWAGDFVTQLGSMADLDDLELVLDPVLAVLMDAVRGQRILRGPRGHSPDGLVNFERAHFFSGLWQILAMVTPDMLKRYAATPEYAGRFALLLRTVFQYVDDTKSQGSEAALRALDALLRAANPLMWNAEGMEGGLTFDDALETLFAKVGDSYEKLSKRAMGFLLDCFHGICASAPQEVRAHVQDRAIQFLLCDVAKLEKGVYEEEARSVALIVLGTACKAGIVPIRTESVWAQPLVEMAMTKTGACGVLQWTLKQMQPKDAPAKSPMFATVWRTLLTIQSDLPASVHEAVWKGHSLFMVDGSYQIDIIRDLLAQYLNRVMVAAAAGPLPWLQKAVFHLFPMMVCLNNALLTTAHKFFAACVARNLVLLREVINGTVQKFEAAVPPRNALGLCLRALGQVFAAAAEAKASVTVLSDCLVVYFCSLSVHPPLSVKTAQAMCKMAVQVSRTCSRERAAQLRKLIDLIKAVPGMPAEDIGSLIRELPTQSATTGRLLPGWVTAASRPPAPPAAPAKPSAVAVAASKIAAAAAHVAPPAPNNKGKKIDRAALKNRDAAPAAAAAAAAMQGAVPGGQPSKKRKMVLPVNNDMKPQSPLAGKILTEQEMTQQRLLPSRESLYQRVLSWSLADIAAEKPDPTLVLSRVPQTFSSPEQYCRVFEPLLLAEVRAAIASTLLDQQYDEAQISMEMVNVGRVNSFWSMTARVKLEAGEVSSNSRVLRDAWSNDDLLEVSSASNKEPMMAIVTKVEWLQAEKKEQVTLLLKPSNPNITWDKLWNCRLVSSVLATAGREHRSMSSLAHLPIQNFILRADLSSLVAESKGGPVPPAVVLARNYNSSQSAAIVSCVKDSAGFVLIQGPPGTGKTKTILGIVGALLMSQQERPAERTRRKRILVCAASNRAVDEVAARLMSGVWDPFHDRMEKIAVVRVGRENATSASVRPVGLEALAQVRCAARTSRSDTAVEHNTEKAAQWEQSLAKLDKQITEATELQTALTFSRSSGVSEATTGQGSSKAEEEVSLKLKTLYEQKREVRQMLKNARESRDHAREAKKFDMAAAKDDVLRTADVVCSTLSGAGSEVLLKLDLEFDAVIVDEATQATELQTLIPLKYRSKLCVLVGDPKQLPATVLSKAAASNAYSQSLFQRLQMLGVQVFMLKTQYRMHPKIASFPNGMFYDGLLENGPNVLGEKYSKPYHQLHRVYAPLVFINCEAMEERTSASSSTMNRGEAALVADLVTEFFKRYGNASASGGMGVITPYRRQMQLIESNLRPRLQAEQSRLVDINTIDGFQGCEKDVVVFSCVRSHEGSSIGFLDDVRRLNVGITRARFCLIIVGNAELLQQHEAFAALVKYAKANNAFVEEDEARKDIGVAASKISVPRVLQKQEAPRPRPTPVAAVATPVLPPPVERPFRPAIVEAAAKAEAAKAEAAKGRTKTVGAGTAAVPPRPVAPRPVVLTPPPLLPALPSLRRPAVPPPSHQGNSLFLAPRGDPINDELNKAGAKRQREAGERRSTVMLAPGSAPARKKPK